MLSFLVVLLFPAGRPQQAHRTGQGDKQQGDLQNHVAGVSGLSGAGCTGSIHLGQIEICHSQFFNFPGFFRKSNSDTVINLRLILPVNCG